MYINGLLKKQRAYHKKGITWKGISLPLFPIKYIPGQFPWCSFQLQRKDALSVLVKAEVSKWIMLFTRGAIGCWIKARWVWRNACPQTYCTALWHNPRNNCMAAAAFFLIAFYARGNFSFPRFSKRSHCSIPMCLWWKSWPASWAQSCSRSWFLEGLFGGDVLSVFTPVNRTEAPLDLRIIQTITAGRNASTTLHNFTICQVVVLPLKKQGGNKFLVKLL